MAAFNPMPIFTASQKDNRMKTYTQEEIHTMAERALDAACLSIQDELGQTDGGIAGIYFSGNKEHLIMQILKDYIAAEIMFAPASE